MAGPNLELFKFGVYVFFPVVIMLHYGNPDWYNEHIIPYRDKFWPTDSSRAVPHNPSELTNEIAQLKLRRFKERQAAVEASASPASSSSP